jgi:protein-tyrosine-phosphatase
MAEGIANSLNQPRFLFSSAGLDPKEIDPATVAFMKEKGMDISRANPRSVESVPNLEHYQIIVALAKEAKRVFPLKTKSICLDWSIPDPSRFGGNLAETRKAYEDAYQQLHAHIQDLVEGILSDKLD